MSADFGLIAGNGRLPILLARKIRKSGFGIIGVGYIGETRKDLIRFVDALHWVHLGELGKTIEILKQSGARKVILVGGIPKVRFFSQIRPDPRALQVLARLPEKKDDAILRAIAAEIETEGLRVESPALFLREFMAARGCMTQRKPTEREARDISFGWSIAKKIGLADVGQTIVVKDQIVLAVEAIEGTDAAVVRGGKLGRGDVAVIKICKPRQDLRLDLPVIGPATVKNLQKAGASLLAVEAGRTIMIDKERVIREADQRQICLMGI